MNQVFVGISELYTPQRRLERAAFAVQDGRFAWVGAEAELPEVYSIVRRLAMKANMPMPRIYLIDSPYWELHHEP